MPKDLKKPKLMLTATMRHWHWPMAIRMPKVKGLQKETARLTRLPTDSN